MALQTLDIEPFSGPLSPRLAEFLRAADAEVERFIEEHLDEPVTSFVPSDYEAVARVLISLRERSLLSGKSFCEWGAGVGAVCGVARILGFSSCGIESRPELVEAGEALMAAHGLDVHLASGSFVPPGAEALADDLDGPSWLDEGCPDAYEELESEISDFDLIFAYPWPGEEHVVERVFERYGEIGAVLVTFRGQEGVVVQRRTHHRRG